MKHPNDMNRAQLEAERDRIKKLTPVELDRLGCGDQDALAEHRELVNARLAQNPPASQPIIPSR